MEATVEVGSGYRPVGFGGAVVRQFRFLWQTRRPLLLLVGLLAAMFLMGGRPFSDGPLARFLTPSLFWVIPIGPTWAFAVFHGEGPSGRLYLWSQPVARSAQILGRLVAGAAWLVLVFAALVLIGWVVAAMDGNADQLATVGVAGWVNLFTGPLIGYAAVSILTVATEHPIRWFFVILLVVPLSMVALVEWLELEDLAETLLQPLANEDWGLGLTMVKGWVHSMVLVQREVQGVSGPAPAGPVPGDLGSWWIATPLWLLGLAAVLAGLSRLHPDILPRWRRGG